MIAFLKRVAGALRSRRTQLALAIRVTVAAVDAGITFFDTAEMYGPYTNEELLGEALAPVRDTVVIATKFGFAHHPLSNEVTGLNSRPAHIKAVADASLRRLKTSVIDLFYQHRVDPTVPIEETVGAMADAVRAGKILHIGISEAAPETIRKAHATHPLAVVQSEYSLLSRDPEAEVLPVLRELGIGFVAYSPLGRGLLTGRITRSDDLPEQDWRRSVPRFQEANLESNARLVQHLGEGRVRAVAMEPTEGMVRGMKAQDLGVPITVPVGRATLGRAWKARTMARTAS